MQNAGGVAKKTEEADKILKAVGGNKVLAEILIKRGITEKEAPGFLNHSLYNPTEPDEFPGMRDAVKFVRHAVEDGKKICVYGDYDVDGVTATALLVQVLRMLGADVIYRVPDRFKEGYGMNSGVVKELHEESVDLILTCDCGISNAEEVELAKKLGMDVVVTDHHALPPELPEAAAVVNSQMLPHEHRAHFVPGVAVAYFLAKALLKTYRREDEAEQFLDLVALGVIADVVPLTGENRYLIQKGMPLLRECGRPGVKALMKAAALEPETITEEDIGFQLCPRINAAGRMEHARLAVELFLSESVDGAAELARKLDSLNKERRQVGDAMLEDAESLLSERTEGPILLYRPHWHQGIIGITAGRLCETYKVPVILMSLKEDGETVVGSARSVEGVHIFEALLECKEHLDRFGGHAGAAGVSLHCSKLKSFTSACTKVLRERMAVTKEVQDTAYDIEIPIEKADKEFYGELRKLAPFGEGWPVPVFYCPGVDVLSVRPTTGEKHLRLVLGHKGWNLPAVQWWAGSAPKMEHADLLYSLSINRWQGKEEVQLVVKELLEPAAVKKTVRKEKKIPRIIDYRSWRELGRPLPLYNDAVYFYEGLPLKDFPEKTKNRYTVTAAKRLVLLSCPPSPHVLKEVVSLSGAEELIFAYSPADITDLKTSIRIAMGYVKFVVNRQGGRASVYDFAKLTGHTELLVMEIIWFLVEKGLLEVEVREYGQMLLKMNPKKAFNAAPSAGLLELLEETNAYRRYMNGCSVETVNF